MYTSDALLSGLAAQWATVIARAEQRLALSSRDGSILRLVPANERLSALELQEQLLQLLTASPWLANHFKASLGAAVSKCKIPRHIAAWARGWAYFQAENAHQALADARTAMAYAQTGPAAAAAAARCPTAATASIDANTAVTQEVATTATQAHENSVNAAAQSKLVTAAAIPLAALISPDDAATTGSASSKDNNSNSKDNSTSSSSLVPLCSWVPALVLAAEAYAALDQWHLAVVHLAKATSTITADGNGCSSACFVRLSQLVRHLQPDQAVAWATGGLNGLVQQLTIEQEVKLPPVLRTRPKWYYYNKWMTQRIHTALLQLHLGHPICGSSNIAGNNNLDGGLTHQQLLEAAEAAADTTAVAAAAAAAGFGSPDHPVAAANQQTINDRDKGPAEVSATKGSTALDKLGNSDKQLQLTAQWQQTQQQQPVLRLPESVISKLLSLDAGDLDFMIKHPTALQAQVYELLDVLESDGPAALEQYSLPHLTWEEVQAMAGSDLVGLPLGYNPPPQTLSATTAASVPALPESSSPVSLLTVPANNHDHTFLTMVPAAAQVGGAVTSITASKGWRRPGWVRSAYLTQAGGYETGVNLQDDGLRSSAKQ